MIEQLNKELMDEKEKQLELTKLKRQKDNLMRHVKVLEEKEGRYKRRLDEEKVDVEKLESISLTGMFLTIAGKKEERLQEEKQEMLQAQLKWQEAKDTVKEMEQEVTVLINKIRKLGDPERAYQALLEKKQQYLLSHDDQDGKRAFELTEQIAELKSDSNEIQEALDAGTRALRALSSAKDSLNSASNWGTLDMLGGGMITTAVKHSKIDDAKGQIHYAQSHLRKFADELDDIGETLAVNLSISGGLTFADYFFDGLITDWFVQGKINDSSHQVDQMYRETSTALSKLRELQTKTKQAIGRLEQEWRTSLEAADLD
ncbi:hypothetical protein [Radiobacillus sp. PE A8.2]|uniref:hypothetical protein n=1 Tax=Radiobacillus sp. PE A8.2 TaxID=3380349 RepID=UPI0038908DBB